MLKRGIVLPQNIIQFAVLPEYFEEICEVLKAHFAAVRDGAGAEAAETEVLLQYGLAEIARI